VKRRLIGLLLLLLGLFIAWQALPNKYSINPAIKLSAPLSEQALQKQLTIHEGFKLSLYANKLNGVRTIITTDTGDLIVSQPSQGTVSLLYHDANGDNRSDGRQILLKQLNKPYGIALHKGWLYVAETDAVVRIPYDSEQRKITGDAERIIEHRFSGGGNHWSRSLKISPDQKLFISVGSTCNVCIEDSANRASILQYELDGSHEILYAQGLRNSVGFDWQPKTLQLYALDNGRDFLGDNTPPEELNNIKKGHHYGWPYEHGSGIKDPTYSQQKPANLQTSQPYYQLIAHSAPLSLLFIKHNPLLKGMALVTLHGSWNRSQKSGYKVIALSMSAQQETHPIDFITGFEKAGTVIGRPVDLTEDNHGNIYLSDDYNGRIYKISAVTSL